MVVPDWALQGDAKDFARLADDPERGPKLRAAIERDLKARDGGAIIRIARFAPQPDRVGLNLVQIAEREGKGVLDVVLDIQRRGGAQAISFGMSEEDVRFVMRAGIVYKR